MRKEYGKMVAVQINADSGLRVTQDGRAIEMTKDKLGFLVLHPALAALTRVELQYWGLCALSWTIA
jgi:hypothetical protein